MVLSSQSKKNNNNWLRGSAFILAIITVGLGLSGIILGFYGCTFEDDSIPILGGLAFSAVGLLIVLNRPRNLIGWMMMVGGFGLAGLSFVTERFIACHTVGQFTLPGVEFAAWVSHRITSLIIVLPIFVFLPFLFPTGRFLSKRWRFIGILGLTLIIIVTIVNALAPDLRVDNGFGGSHDFDSPISINILTPAIHEVLFRAQVTIIIFLSIAGIASMVLRLKRSRGIERQQMKWFAYFLATAVTMQLLVFELTYNIFGEDLLAARLPWFETLYNIVLYIVFIGFPFVIGLAIFRYRLYDIDIIIQRTLVYSIVTLSLAAVYFASIILLQLLFTGISNQQSPLAIVISTLLIAALFTPLRRRVQNFIDRRFYRKQYDAQQVLARFGQTARDETNIERLTDELAQVVQESMQPESIMVWIKK